MTGLIIFIHVVICILLIAIILMQPGKGGGLTDSMASAESIFGAQTNVFIIKTTAILAGFFLVTCLGLAILSSQKNKSPLLKDLQEILKNMTGADAMVIKMEK